MKKIILLLLFVFLLTSCATQAKYEAKVSAWQGKNMNDLIAQWDYPDYSFKAPNGNTVYVYSRQIQEQEDPDDGLMDDPFDPYAPMDETVFVYDSGDDIITLWCKTYFVVNKQSIIVHWYLQGNDCVSK